MAFRRVSLEWEGKDAAALEVLKRPVPTTETLELFGPDHARDLDATARHERHVAGRLILGDAADVARSLATEGLEGQVDLVYLDPPYASGTDYTHEERTEGKATGKVARATAYKDRWDEGHASYLDMLYPRISAMRPLLRRTGSIWIQVDWRANYLVRALCDEIFGRDRFLNEIVWRRAPNLGRQARSGQFGRTLDTIVVYGASAEARLYPPSKLVPYRGSSVRHDAGTARSFTLAPRGDYTDESVAKLELEGRIHRSPSGNVYVKYWLETDGSGQLCKRQAVDALWTDIPPLRHVSPEERTGYPTQKPRKLLERVFQSGSPEGGLIVDLFAGSGTSASAAASLGRRFIVGDRSPVAVAIMRNRLERERLAFCVQGCGQEGPSASIEAEVLTAPAGPSRLRVELRCARALDLLSWAVGPSNGPGKPFVPSAYLARAPGRRSNPLSMSTEIAATPDMTELRVRLYFVTGETYEVTQGLAAPQPTTCATGLRA